MAPRGSSAALCSGLALGLALFLSFSPFPAALTWTAACAAVVCGLLVLCLRRGDDRSPRRACVLVLGDIGRSPRMQYHALSLSKHGFNVTFVGFVESKPHPDVLREGNIKIRAISEVRGITVGPKLLAYVTKVSAQCLQLLFVLLSMDLQAFILMQNPPGLPGIAVAWLVGVVRGSRLIIDWHNYGYSIMALSHGERHLVVRAAQWYERVFGPLADRNLCVTDAMKEDLQKNWGIRATTLYDRPASVFRETAARQKHQLFVKLGQTLPAFRHIDSGDERDDVEQTAFTQRDVKTGTVDLKEERPALVVSSTSWTEDEDFSILLKALEEYEAAVKEGATLPPLVCVITGKGPQKQFYLRLMDALRLQHVQICTPWLEAEDYPVLLGCADLGVCLHLSSSGLDLPMKVVDMFGCCLPVCAVHFRCLHELVKHDENGLVFRDAHELARQLQTLLADFPSAGGDGGKLGSFRSELRRSRGPSWDQNWDQNVPPLLPPH
ncbi:chitobiosyldiphosphodolichol beta-mannosyltransferase [Eucyclogobius newberryi]|uniref:chitobiosyldiphosphodolichol beta-mannosyltransferase n=1 Tax=Eucyclogobius newberryi TaxID=166745 RepID=UPI003B5959B9